MSLPAARAAGVCVFVCVGLCVLVSLSRVADSFFTLSNLDVLGVHCAVLKQRSLALGSSIPQELKKSNA